MSSEHQAAQDQNPQQVYKLRFDSQQPSFTFQREKDDKYHDN